ncbi:MULTISPECIES: heavy metal translocating P-type ATPase [unclassified Cupriavidus]|uniref:heavy metal translocating P-type ATPase n=1 Tax=unclassified Cupriavidus TaxID=2640874 RepID=UPI001C008CDD|nr:MULTISPECIES: heavy metal translocating P-type ATPase [unclassified Cupriavidus]MCA3190924.1 heavy metal translocating P-type ATPase [Cupriavidus sp.]MCA3196531.1 heavy metal translocating P-type ATPase [Cupriavidus sp.]MCA3205421.1 heavy metal translocating P-type ATPase [Cupriavidus sp.]MCA3206207.1 heavy metal translocating P-type ATPase [Cupriavidus sp.]MCA3234000.1 heavy metal translocating P-type ATPase [Cupriavidus sp.]
MARTTPENLLPPSSAARGHGHDHDHSHDHAHDHAGHDHDHTPASPAAASCGCGTSCATPIPMGAPVAAPAGTRSAAFRIEAMDCPTEETLIRNKIGNMAGVAALDFNLMQRVLTVHHTLDAVDPVVKAIASLGMKAEPLSDESAKAAVAEPGKPWWPLALGGAAAIGAELAEWFQIAAPYLPAALALATVLVSGLGVYRKGWIAVRNGNLNINALMSIAVTGAMVIGQWPEAAMVMVLFALAERIEAASLDRARNAVRGLMAMAPEQATVLQADGSWQVVEASAVVVGTTVRLRPGERVALDGRVLRGQSALDQAPITGESVPVDKAPGDPLYAGSINQSGELEYTVTAPATDSTLARIIHAVEAAQGSRAPTQRFVDQFARIYTPVIFVIALGVAVVPPLLMGGAWLAWIYKALVLLVIACPCALVISTPVTIVSGLAAAARRGILVKGGVYLEQGRHLAWLALDKTGTLTHGKPARTDMALLVDDMPQAHAIAASLAARSDHPVSHAVATAAEAEGIARLDVSDFAALPGQGVKGTVDGVAYSFGNHRLIHELGACSVPLEARLEAIERQGKSIVMLAETPTDGRSARALILFGVADTVRDTSRQAIEQLHALGVKTLMLSGDNPHTAQAIGQAVGIDEVRGNQLPEDKAAAIAALADRVHTHGGKVGMVGDGINDAPALARADIGFAMGAAGTDTAIETADVALMDDDLRKIPAFVRLSRRTSAILRQNITLSLAIKAVFLALTLMGMGSMWMAVFADMGASLLVVFNGLRLTRKGVV